MASPYRRPLQALPRARRNRNPWVRVGLAAAVLAMLPFNWSEDSTCEHLPRPPVTGVHILTHDGWQPAAVFFAFLFVAVGLGFFARATYRLWLRLSGEVFAALVGTCSFLMCLGMMTYGRQEQPLVYPAAWIGTLAAATLAFEAWWASGEAARRWVERRRAVRALRKEMAAGRAPPARIAEVGERGGGEEERGGEEEERDVVAEAEAMAEEEMARRRER